ncbi:DNA-binding NarL/FixJ family response regulator (plasmid) [Ensifer sp. WSM1721]|uniref:response regulator transcription factor n=1 Tax=Ensifer sp. WSM1721 TaxID=1041159 RepID=UPI0018DDC754|nr:response regulator transcription factor [Ensifer sp. WSM1721]
MFKKSEGGIVLVVDVLELRRAGITSLVDEWARAIGLEAVGISPDEMPAHSQLGEVVRFVILSIGGSSLREGVLQNWAKSARELFPNAPRAIISDRMEAEEAIVAAQIGEQGFLSTSMEPGIARQALTFILGGGTFFPREALLHQYASTARSVKSQAHDHKNENEGLTRRQNEVLERLRQGRSNKHIARDLEMEESTVKVHVRQIMRKLGASNRTQAALFGAAVLDKGPGTAPVQNGASNAVAPALLARGGIAIEQAGRSTSAGGARPTTSVPPEAKPS